jgi:hypothetical protein
MPATIGCIGARKSSLVLFQTLGCHLCEEALEVIGAVPRAHSSDLESVDIADDDNLLARYGERIPVLRRPDSGAELDWPFTVEEVDRFLSGSPG